MQSHHWMIGSHRAKLLGALASFVALLMLAGCGQAQEFSSEQDLDAPQDLLYSNTVQTGQFEPYYSERLQEWEAAGIPFATETIEIRAKDVKAHSDTSTHRIAEYAGVKDALIWRNETSNWLEYEVEVKQPGLYELLLVYHAYQDESGSKNYRPTVMSVQVDGEFPFREARSITFTRLFKDELPLRQDEYGDDIRPRPLEIDTWITRPFKDSEGAYVLPLRWKFEAGKHTIRLQTQDSIVMDKIILTAPTTIPSYEEYVASQPGKQGNTGAMIQIEAEIMEAKNDVSLQMASDQDPLVTPVANGRVRFNAVGGSRWEQGGKAITWSFEVPESGWYKIGFRAFQGYQTNKRIFRTIYLDGQIPFQELAAYPFEYATGWQGVILADEERQPYEVYLEAGQHTLTLEATYAPFASVLRKVDDTLIILNGLSRDLNALIGTDDDMNRTWNIENDFPEIIKKAKYVHRRLKQMEAELIEINGRSDNNAELIRSAIRDMEDLLKYPNDIPYKRGNVSKAQQNLASIREPLAQGPLLLDKIYVVPREQEFPRMRSNMWERMRSGINQFFLSFNNERQLSAGDADVLNVWMAYGRDYVNVLQDLADQYFTPETGIKVKVDLLPDENLIVLANAADRVPDVAIGLSEGRPVELAIRGAAAKISQFPDYQEIVEQYAPGAMMPYYYAGDYYAVPETQQFNVLFYRKDIIEELGLDIPETWDDVIRMLPTLQQNGYDFHIPTDYLPFIYQNGAEFYSEDGITTALDSAEGFQAFKQYTDFYLLYGIKRQVSSFYQHFRDGTMPIGLGDFNMFLQVAVAAPELRGWWGIAPIPGIRQDDGEIARWAGGGQKATMIFAKSNKKEQAWQFMKWWLDAETQARFGSDLEGFYGISFRWNTANIEAFTRFPWQNEELNVFLEQWRWYKDMAHVPGSYYIPRELNNAWNRTVLDGQNYRSALEEAVLNINRELRRKAVEFNYIDSEGNIVKTYDPPMITEPWEGAEKYVR